MSLHTLTLAELAAGLERRDLSSVELTRHFLDRIARFDGKANGGINSYITVTPERALAQAGAADAARAAGNAGALTGVPLAQKDIFCTEGVKTTCASKMLDSFISPYNAEVVSRCDAAGLVMLGKTNMDEFAMGSSNETSAFGPVVNPWKSTTSNADLTPGGSSGG